MTANFSVSNVGIISNHKEANLRSEFISTNNYKMYIRKNLNTLSTLFIQRGLKWQ
jgi:hypothetical protein